MNITIISSNPFSEEIFFESYLHRYQSELKAKGVKITNFNLRDLDIKFCIGCWTCWWKTPGECVFNDNMNDILSKIIQSDLVIFASPIILGFTNSLLKKINDRMIPLLHPYIEIVKGECHHKKRYKTYPKLGLLLIKEADTDEEDLRIIKDIYKRFALNFRSELSFFHTMDDNDQEELINDTLHI